MKKADIVLIAVIAVVVGILIFVLYGLNNEPGAYVQVEVDGNVVETLPLDTDVQREIKTDNGGLNILVIEDGRAMMTDANCPDGICVNHMAISRSGESIICLPHKVVISVVDDEKADDDIDAVA